MAVQNRKAEYLREIFRVFRTAELCFEKRFFITNSAYHDYEGNNIFRFFKERKVTPGFWGDVYAHYRGSESAIVSFLTEEGFSAFLPCFFMSIVDVEDNVDVWDSFANSVFQKEFRKQAIVNMTEEQKRVCYEVCEDAISKLSLLGWEKEDINLHSLLPLLKV